MTRAIISAVLVAVLTAVCISTNALSDVPSQTPNNCICQSNQKKCKCCNVINFDHKLREIHLNDTVCMKIRNLRKNMGFRFAVYWNKRSLVSHPLTTTKIPPFCFATPYAKTVDVCLLFTKLRITPSAISGCFHYEIESQPLAAVFHGGCFKIRRKSVMVKKTIPGNPLSLLHSSDTKHIPLTDKHPLHNFINAIDGINKTSLAMWMKLAKNKTAKTRKKTPLEERNETNIVGRPSADCGCRNRTVTVCHCCVMIAVKKTRLRGCLNVTHVPYRKDLRVTFKENQKLKINEHIPGHITKKVCSHYKTGKGLKVGVCIKPTANRKSPNTTTLCIYIDARQPHFRLRQRVGCQMIIWKK